MSDFTWLENGSMRCLLVSAAFPLPHESPATLTDIKAALAEKELCVVPKGRHDWVFAEEVMKRDEEIARLTAENEAWQAKSKSQADSETSDVIPPSSFELKEIQYHGERGKSSDAKGDEGRLALYMAGAAAGEREIEAWRRAAAKTKVRLEEMTAERDDADARAEVAEKRAAELEAQLDEARLRQEDVERDIRSMFDLEGDADWPAVVAGIRMAWRDAKKQLAAEQQKRQEVERRECLDHQEIAEALGILEQLPDQAGVVAEIVRLRAELAAEKNASKSSNGSPNPPGISESSVEPDESDPLPWHSAATAPRSALPEWRITRVRGATAFLREAWEHNDGAEGESVRLVCDELEALLDANGDGK